MPKLDHGNVEHAQKGINAVEAQTNRMPVALVVDDQLSQQKLMGYLLSAAGFEVAVAENGLEALDWLAARTPDVILLDYVMPEMDGVVFLRALRELERGVPVIFVTAMAMGLDPAEVLALGARAFLVKPFSTKTLLDQVRACVGMTGSLTPIQRLSPPWP